MIRITGDFIAHRLLALPITVLFLSACGGSASTDVASSGPGSTVQASVPPCGIEGTGLHYLDCQGGGSPSGPNPTIDFILPSCAPAGGPAFTLTVVGSNFAAGSVVQWNGSGRPTTVSSTQLDAEIPASDIAGAGTAAVTVFNPAPGGASSSTSTFTIAGGGVSPQSVAVDPTGTFAYVANTGCPDSFVGNVSMYKINATTGVLTSIGSPVEADFGPHSVAVDPAGKFVYVANDGDFEVTGGSVSIYTIDVTTGALTPMGTIAAPCAPPPSPGGCAPYSVAVDPSGKFVYVANEGGFAPTSVSMYSINATTGALTSVGTIAAGGRAVSVAVHPSGKFAYVVVDGIDAPGGVSMFNITGGALTFGGTIAAGTGPLSVAVDPTGKFAYVTNVGSNDVSMYTINATTGVLTSIGVMATGTNPVSIAVDPTGKFAYVANSGSNNVSMYTINATTGALTSIGFTLAGTTSVSIAVDPTGKFVYVANSGSNNLSMYSINGATGALTPLGTIGT